MKTSTKKKIKNAGKNFMLELLQTINDLAQIFPRPFETKFMHIQRIRRYFSSIPPKRISQGIIRLKRRDLIKENKKNKSIELTLSGKQKLLAYKLKSLKEPSFEGLSTIVIFDIPEKKSKHRMYLRRLLLKNDFINIQKSVLISHFELPKEFYELIKDLELEQNVKVIKGKIKF